MLPDARQVPFLGICGPGSVQRSFPFQWAEGNLEVIPNPREAAQEEGGVNDWNSGRDLVTNHAQQYARERNRLPEANPPFVSREGEWQKEGHQHRVDEKRVRMLIMTDEAGFPLREQAYGYQEKHGEKPFSWNISQVEAEHRSDSQHCDSDRQR